MYVFAPRPSSSRINGSVGAKIISGLDRGTSPVPREPIEGLFMHRTMFLGTNFELLTDDWIWENEPSFSQEECVFRSEQCEIDIQY